jgi:hypothetical protein
MRQHHPVFPSAFHARWKASTAYSFYPVALRHLFGVVHMYNTLDLSNEQDFLQFCDSIDLTSVAGATFQVGSEVTGTIEA